MEQVRIVCQSDESGMLHLNIPAGRPKTQFEVTVHWTPTDGNWPAGYFEAVPGSIDDVSFLRHPQGDLEERTSFE